MNAFLSFLKKIGLWDEESAKQFKAWNKANNQSFVDFVTGKKVDASGNPILSLINKQTGADVTGAEKATMDYNAEEAKKNRDWQTEMANTTYQRTVTDLQNAGLNPALAMNNGASVPTPSGNAGAVGLSNNGSNLLDAIIQLKNLSIQQKLADADVRLKNANANKTEKETSWIDRLNSLNARSYELQNSLTDEQIENAKKTGNLMEQELKKKIEETKNAAAQGLLIDAQRNLAKLDYDQKVAMYPYQEALVQAQTNAQKAQASLAFANAAMQNGLLKAGAIDLTIEKMKNENRFIGSNADVRTAEAAIADFKRRVKTGDFSGSVTTGNKKVDNWLNNHIFGPFFATVNALGECTIGQLGGIIK